MIRPMVFQNSPRRGEGSAPFGVSLWFARLNASATVQSDSDFLRWRRFDSASLFFSDPRRDYCRNCGRSFELGRSCTCGVAQ